MADVPLCTGGIEDQSSDNVVSTSMLTRGRAMNQAGTARRRATALAIGAVAALALTGCGGGSVQGGGGGGGKPIVGLITKTDTNPFFLKMKEGAQHAASRQGVELHTFAGKPGGSH